MPFLKSSWSEIRGNAAVIIGNIFLQFLLIAALSANVAECFSVLGLNYCRWMKVPNNLQLKVDAPTDSALFLE